MIRSNIRQICVWSLGLCLFCGVTSMGIEQMTSIAQTQSDRQADIIADLVEADIVYLGEKHDRIGDHNAQLAIIVELYR